MIEAALWPILEPEVCFKIQSLDAQPFMQQIDTKELRADIFKRKN